MSDSAEFSAGARGPVGPDAATTGVFPTKARRYRAFIRHSRADPPWAKWLLKKLEDDGVRELQRRNRRLTLITAASVVGMVLAHARVYRGEIEPARQLAQRIAATIFRHPA